MAYYFSEVRPEPFHTTSRYITDLAEAWIYILASLLGLVAFKWVPRFKSQKKYKIALTSLKAFIFTGITINILKFIFGRQRPFLSETCDAHIFTWFNWHWDFQSIPSGHTQVVFTFWALTHFLRWKWSYLVFIYATLLASTRIIIFRHFISDVLLSVAISYVCVWWIVSRFNKAEAGRT